MYPLTNTTSSQASIPSTFAAFSPSLWCDRFGHPASQVRYSLTNNKFIDCKNNISSSICPSCPLDKLVKLPFYSSVFVTSMPFDIVRSDLWTSPIISTAGHHYYVLFLDDFTNFLWTFPISNKSQVYSIFLQFRAHIRTQFEREIKCFQCDNGLEYDKKICETHGMSFCFSCPHTSHQNGKAEWKIQ